MFADLNEEAVTGVDCDGVVFDPNHFKAVREASLCQLNTLTNIILAPKNAIKYYDIMLLCLSLENTL